MPSFNEGYVSFKSYKTYYKIYGDVVKQPVLLILHGGPGYPHYYLENLSELTSDYAVVFYDQLGCGKSSRPNNPNLWTINLFIDELDKLRSELGLSTIHILGHSWGGSLAAEYMLTKPNGVKSLILASPLLDSQLWVKEADALKDKLPKKIGETMRMHEFAGTTSSPEYATAYAEFSSNFVCRIKPYPEVLKKADEEVGLEVYTTMWGPSEAFATGSLKNWSVTNRLREIKTPTLFTSGKYDEATPKQIKLGAKQIKNSKWELFKKSSHLAHLEEPKPYIKTIRKFLARNNN